MREHSAASPLPSTAPVDSSAVGGKLEVKTAEAEYTRTRSKAAIRAVRSERRPLMTESPPVVGRGHTHFHASRHRRRPAQGYAIARGITKYRFVCIWIYLLVVLRIQELFSYAFPLSEACRCVFETVEFEYQNCGKSRCVEEMILLKMTRSD